MKQKIKIERVNTWSIVITIIIAVLFGFISFQSEREFHVLQTTTEQYILCEKAAKQLQDGSDYLTEQIRLYVMTTEKEYLELYFKEANETQRRENAVADLKQYFSDTETFDLLKSALQCSIEANLPAISLSVGVAFSDKENPGESIFKDADKALYYVKEHGKSGCGFY